MAKGILIRKLRKLIYIIVKAYCIISLLKCLGKIVEKLVVELIIDFTEF